MGLTVEHAVAAFALLAALLALWVGRRVWRGLGASLRQLGALRRGRDWPVDRLPVGSHVGLEGNAAPIDSIESPHTGRSAIYLRWIEEVWDNTPNMVGAAGKWVCAAQDEEAAPFEITDGEHTVPVDPTGAEVLAPSTSGTDRAAGKRYTEALLAPQQRLIVLGHLTEQGGFTPGEGYRGTSFRRVLAAGPRGLVIGAAGTLRRRLTLRLALGLLGLLGLLAVLAGALLVAAQALPVIHVELPGDATLSGDPARAWQLASGEPEPAGPASAEAWVLGWITGGRPGLLLHRRLRQELWRHRLNDVAARRVTRRRAWLVFEVIRIEGQALRYPAFWEQLCRTTPERCR